MRETSPGPMASTTASLNHQQIKAGVPQHYLRMYKGTHYIVRILWNFFGTKALRLKTEMSQIYRTENGKLSQFSYVFFIYLFVFMFPPLQSYTFEDKNPSNFFKFSSVKHMDFPK